MYPMITVTMKIFLKRILLPSLFSPPVDYIPITVGSKLHGRDPEELSAPASLPGTDGK